MTNAEKSELRRLCKQGLSFSEILEIVDCSDQTIKLYMKVFSKTKKRKTLILCGCPLRYVPLSRILRQQKRKSAAALNKKTEE